MEMLIAHPDSLPQAVQSIAAGVIRTAAGLAVEFHLAGDIAALVIPLPGKPGRADELWRTTCFELFLKGKNGFYRELNFTPSGHWAAYAFDHYRSGMRDVDALVATQVARTETTLTLAATIRIDLTDVTRLGLSAIIEESGGRKSYWALAHPAGPPDFHEQTCFRALLADIAQS